jgi:hypothetical protein
MKSIGLAAAIAMAVLSAGPPAAHAGTLDPDATRIGSAGHSLEWNWTPPGKDHRYGHAETLVHAPIAAVRQHVLDFRHYRDILPDKFKTSRVVAHGSDGSADVYLQIAILHGVVTLWDVTRFSPVENVSPSVEVVEGHMVPGKGNIDAMDVTWTLRALDDGWTVLKVDLLLRPGVPAPEWAIDEELRDSARYAVDAVHDRAQGSRTVERWAPLAP